MKNERGITLISLTVTLIVMLILAGVAIYGSLYENDGGLINMVKDENSKQQNMVQEEKNKMNTVLQDVEEEWGIGSNV